MYTPAGMLMRGMPGMAPQPLPAMSPPMLHPGVTPIRAEPAKLAVQRLVSLCLNSIPRMPAYVQHMSVHHNERWSAHEMPAAAT